MAIASAQGAAAAGDRQAPTLARAPPPPGSQPAARLVPWLGWKHYAAMLLGTCSRQGGAVSHAMPPNPSLSRLPFCPRCLLSSPPLLPRCCTPCRHHVLHLCDWLRARQQQGAQGQVPGEFNFHEAAQAQLMTRAVIIGMVPATHAHSRWYQVL